MADLPDPFELAEGSNKLDDVIERGLPEKAREDWMADKSRWVAVNVRIPRTVKRQLETLKSQTHVPIEEWVTLAVVRFLDAYAKGEGEPIEIRTVATRQTIW